MKYRLANRPRGKLIKQQERIMSLRDDPEDWYGKESWWQGEAPIILLEILVEVVVIGVVFEVLKGVL